jgi:hypothetical protein
MYVDAGSFRVARGHGRVTKLGEFSQIELLESLGNFEKLMQLAQFLGIFPLKKFCV